MKNFTFLIVFWTIAACCLHAQVPYTLSFAIQDGADDAEEAVPTGAMNLSSSDLEMTMEANEQIIGLRFANVAVPQGATVTGAFIQFTTDETDDVATNLLIEGELAADAPAFSATANDISSRSRTAASVAWEDIPAWNTVGEAGPDQRTPDLTDIVLEVINQADWSAGNAMAFIITGTGNRNAVSFNNSANAPARLVITYEVTEFPLEAFPVRESTLWRYEDSGMDLGTEWTALDYDDSSWAFGQAELGYGDGDENTTLSFGGDPDDKHITYYFRKTFTVAAPSALDALNLRLLRDDGAVVYLNGEEVARSNMPAGAIDFQTTASSAVAGGSESAFEAFEVPTSALQAGENILAVEIHQANPSSSDISFNLSLEEEVVLPPAIQLIHNSPDPSLQFVDVYIDAFNQGNFVKFNGDTPIPFRFGTPYLSDLPAGTHGIAIAPFGTDDFMWSATTFTLEANKRYIAMVSGVREPANFETAFNSADDIAFKIQVNEVPGNEDVSAGETLPLLFHGTPDLPNIRLIAVGAGDATADFPEGLPYAFQLLGGTVDALPYPNVQVTNNASTEVYGEFKTDLTPFTEQVITIFSSGFYTAEGDAGVDESNFALVIMPESGGPGVLLPAPDPPLPGKIQIIHNSPDPELSAVDVWLNGEKVVEALDYLNATAFVDIPAGQNRVAVAPHSTTMADTAWSATDLFVEADLDLSVFQPVGRTYTAVAYGARNTADFDNATNPDVSFGLAVEEGRSAASAADMVDLRFFHGATDAPGVDFVLDGQFIPVVNDLNYSNYSSIYVTLPADMFQLNMTPQDDNNQLLSAYGLSLEDRAGEALVVLAAGLLDPQEGQPAFGLHAVDANGNVSELPIVTNTGEQLRELGIKIFPNPATDALYINAAQNLPEMRLLDVTGKALRQLSDTGTQTVINLQDMPKGLYFLELQLEGGNQAVKILKQ